MTDRLLVLTVRHKVPWHAAERFEDRSGRSEVQPRQVHVLRNRRQP